MVEGTNVNIKGNVTGDLIGVGVSGNDITIAKKIVYGTVRIDSGQLENIDEKFAEGLKAFVAAINQQLKANGISSEKTELIQEGITEFVKESENVNHNQEVSVIKCSDLRSKFIKMARVTLKVLPKTAETAALFTPLAPFSKQIGEATQYLVESLQKES